MSIQNLVLKVRRRENGFYALLYRLAKGALAFRVPVIRPLCSLLYYERSVRHTAFGILKKVFYYEPLFRARCEYVGEHLTLIDGIPCIEGNLCIRIGDWVTLYGVTSLVANQVHEHPVLEIGDNTHIGYQTLISVGESVRIGSHCFISNTCRISDNDGHPMDLTRRRNHAALTPDEIRPVVIEDDAWIGARVIVMKGVTIGRGAIVGAGSVVTKDIPPYTIAAGNPARVIRAIDCSEAKEDPQ